MHTGLLTKSLGQVLETSPLEFDLTGTPSGQSARFHPTEGGGQTQFPYGVGVLHLPDVCSRFSGCVRSSIGFLVDWLTLRLGGAGVCALAALWGGR